MSAAPGPAAAADPLSGYPVRLELPVVWGEMDAYGHVNNVVYFRWFESARMAYFERLGCPEFIGRNPVGPILAEASCRFRAALAYPDRVTVGAAVEEIAADRFRMRYAVWSSALGRIAAEGEGTVVCFDYREGRKAPVPEAVRQAIARLESSKTPGEGS